MKKRRSELTAQNEAPDYRYFNFAQQSQADVGYALGVADPPFKMQSWWAQPVSAAFAQRCFDIVRELHPPLADEFMAYCAAQRMPPELLWQMCCRVNLKAHLKASVLDIGEGCSTFAYFAPNKLGTVVGRNYDYWHMQARRQRIRFVPNCHALASIGSRGGVPCGRYDGINQHGVFVSLHVVMTDNPREDEINAGVPFHLVGRIALELCSSAREAVDLLTRITHLSSLNYLVADATDAFIVEADARRVRVLARTGDVVAATNHFRHPDMQPLQGRRANTNSECRLGFLLRGWGNTQMDTDALLARAQHIMQDRSAPVCGLSGSLTTLWSCVAELHSKRIRYAPGAPVHVAYEEIEKL